MRKGVTVQDRTNAVQKGVRDALLGHSVCVERGGKVVWLSPPEIPEELRRSEQETQDPTTNDR